MTHVLFIVNNIAMQEAGASAAMILTLLAWTVLISTQEGLSQFPQKGMTLCRT